AGSIVLIEALCGDLPAQRLQLSGARPPVMMSASRPSMTTASCSTPNRLLWLGGEAGRLASAPSASLRRMELPKFSIVMVLPSAQPYRAERGCGVLLLSAPVTGPPPGPCVGRPGSATQAAVLSARARTGATRNVRRNAIW